MGTMGLTMLKLTAAIAACILTALTAYAFERREMQMASGLIEIMKKAEPCGYRTLDAVAFGMGTLALGAAS